MEAPMKHGPMNIDELIDFIADEARRVREAASLQAGPDGDAQAAPRAKRRRGWHAAHAACRTRSPRSALVH